jgi:hypothetical protein
MVGSLHCQPVHLACIRSPVKRDSGVGKVLVIGGHKYGKLSQLPDMPLDVLFEVSLSDPQSVQCKIMANGERHGV